MLSDQLQDVREEYLDITEKGQIDNSVSDITYISREPESSRFNAVDNIIIVFNPTSTWLLPSMAYLYVEGALLQTDGTPYTKDTQGEYPNVALGNNAAVGSGKRTTGRILSRNSETRTNRIVTFTNF